MSPPVVAHRSNFSRARRSPASPFWMSVSAMGVHTHPVLAANWKMNHGPAAAAAFLDSFLSLHAPRADRTVILFPSALAPSAVRAGLASRPDIRVLSLIHISEPTRQAEISYA